MRYKPKWKKKTKVQPKPRKKRQPRAKVSLEAVETAYKGYRFRSRLEARWAVFFDALGVEWLYEAEGYQTPDGPYLPDFILAGPKGTAVCEVKPRPLTAKEQRKLEHVSDGLKAQVSCRLGHPPTTVSGYPEFGWFTEIGCYSLSKLNGALAAARSARFEHGDKFTRSTTSDV